MAETIKEKRAEVSKALNNRRDHLVRHIAVLESERRLEPYSELASSLRAGTDLPGEHLTRHIPASSPTALMTSAFTQIPTFPAYDIQPTRAERIESGREEIKKIEKWLTDINEGEFDAVLDDLIREIRAAR